MERTQHTSGNGSTYPRYRIDAFAASEEVFVDEPSASNAAFAATLLQEEWIGVYVQRDEAQTPEMIYVVIP